MIVKSFPPRFRKADAVALYQSRPEVTIGQVAAELGLSAETLRNWVRAAGASRPRGRRPSRRRVTEEPPHPQGNHQRASRNRAFGQAAPVAEVHAASRSAAARAFQWVSAGGRLDNEPFSGGVHL
ncbi:transposase [Streptomyces sp. NPDC059003]|uniref:transposase n=1 Tax=Streptomyces sp. NPDC059003 TaxID=3346691 RepID=UPI0036B358B7